MNQSIDSISSVLSPISICQQQGASSVEVRDLCTDTRQVVNASQSLFVAIDGKRHDGHQFLWDIYQKGCRAFLVERSLDAELLKQLDGAWIWQVPSSIEAIQLLAIRSRQYFAGPVIGITGSNGKTVVKEIIVQLIGSKVPLLSTPHSYNSQIGVALSVWPLAKSHELGVFEAGISQPAEMVKLAAMIQPTIGVFTNLGAAHDEGFADRYQKAAEKAQLFANSEVVVAPSESQEIKAALAPLVEKGTEVLYWKLTAIGEEGWHLWVNGKHLCILPAMSLVDAENLTGAVLALNRVFPETPIEQWFSLAHEELAALRIPKRMAKVEGVNGLGILDDSYSLDISSLEVALRKMQAWSEETASRKLMVALSDFAGNDEKWLESQRHQAITLLKQNAISQVFLLGEAWQAISLLSTPDFLIQVFETIDALEAAIKTQYNALLLIKGNRAAQFERLVKRLSKSAQITHLEIDLDGLVHNLNVYKALLKPETQLMGMVKASAYGSGAFEVANLLVHQGIKYLAVAYPDEGIALLAKGIKAHIMVMNTPIADLYSVMEAGLEPVVYSLEGLRYIVNSHQTKPSKQQLTFHLEVNTGMNRLGVEPGEMEDLFAVLRALPKSIKLATVFTHLAGADEAVFDVFTANQLKQFDAFCEAISVSLPELKPLKHALNSSGMVRFPANQYDLVRLGIGLYGIDPSGTVQESLKTVARLKSAISQIHQVKSGESVGYSRRFVSHSDKVIATVPIGYADGLPRRLGNGLGVMMVKGQRVPIVGSVCMDMTMIDVTGLKAQVGDEVILFDEHLTIGEWAEKLGTIPYEVLTNIHERVKRVFIST